MLLLLEELPVLEIQEVLAGSRLPLRRLRRVFPGQEAPASCDQRAYTLLDGLYRTNRPTQDFPGHVAKNSLAPSANRQSTFAPSLAADFGLSAKLLMLRFRRSRLGAASLSLPC